MLEVALREDLRLPWLCLLVTVGLAPTLLWRRTHPFAVVAVAFGVSAAVDVGLIIADEPALDMYTTGLLPGPAVRAVPVGLRA